MANMTDWYTGQLVAQQELDKAFGYLEDAERAILSDLVLYGIFEGLSVVQHAGTPNLTVDIAAGGAYASGGERMRVAVNPTVVDLSVDKNSVTTTVTVNGQSRIVSVVLTPDRALSDPRTDAMNNTVYFERGESYKFEVIQGAQAGVPTPPAIPAGSILLADVTRLYNQTQILTGNISTARRQDAHVYANAVATIRRGLLKDALGDIWTRYGNHVIGSQDQHAAGDVSYGGSGLWADGNPGLSAGTLASGLDEVVSDLSAMAFLDSGGRRIGVEQDTSVATIILAAATLNARLQALRLASNLWYAGSGTWAGGASGLAASSIEAAIDGIVAALGAAAGAAKIGTAAVGNFAATTLQGIIAAIASTSGGSDGASKVGTATSGNLSGVTVRAQLDELDAEKGGLATANSWTATNTFTNQIEYTSRSRTRLQTSALYNASTGIWSPDGSLGMAASDIAEQVLSELGDASTLTTVTAWIKPSTDGTGLSGTKATLEVKRRNIETGALATLGSIATDATANGAGYLAQHSFAVTGLTEVVDRTKYRYYVLVSGETGTGATSISFKGCTTTMTITKQPEVQ